MTRKLFVTTALPYANAAFHIGHMMEYIQADTWVRAQRMRGAEVNFVCADDAHGAPIMIAAEKAGKTPQQFVADIAAGRPAYLNGFHIAFDNWHSTDGPENHALAQSIYLALRKNELIDVRTVEQFFDPEKQMFLPDRFIKGECPKCGTKDQYGDNCENCGAVYAPTDLKNPYSALSGATPVLKTSEHYFFKLSDPRCVAFLEQWTQDGKLQPEVANKVKEWFSRDEDGKTALNDWDISRDAPYFGIQIPDAPGKYFYVWLDAPVGYLASLKNLLDRRGEDMDAYLADKSVEQYHFIGKDIVTFHTLFWPATLKFSGRKVPDSVFVHGFLTVNNGEKMSKSYGNTVELFGDEKATRKKIMSIVMDSRTPQEPKPDADQNLAIRLLKLVAAPEVAADFENRLRAGGLGYGDLKKALFENYWNYFAPARARRAELAANLDYVEGVLREGAERARAVGTGVLKRAKKACGLD